MVNSFLDLQGTQLRITRLIVTALFLGVMSIVLRQAPLMESASGIFQTSYCSTSYSTTTSTSYSSYTIATATSTLHSIKVDTEIGTVTYTTSSVLWSGATGSAYIWIIVHTETSTRIVTRWVPVATHTYPELQTRAYQYTITIAYTISTVLFSVGATETLLVLVLAGIIVAAVLFLRRWSNIRSSSR